MGIRRFFQERAYRKRLSTWPDMSPLALELRISPMSVNGLTFHSQLELAEKLGAPTDASLKNRDFLELLYRQHGLILNYYAEKLESIIVCVCPEKADYEGELNQALVTLNYKGAHRLSCETRPGDINALFGEPTEDHMGVTYTLSHYIDDNHSIETEFTRDGELIWFEFMYW